MSHWRARNVNGRPPLQAGVTRLQRRIDRERLLEALYRPGAITKRFQNMPAGVPDVGLAGYQAFGFVNVGLRLARVSELVVRKRDC